MSIISLGSRVEMLLDDYLIDKKDGLAFRLNKPVRRDFAIRTDRPWEHKGSIAYPTVLKWNGLYHMYYRAWCGIDHTDSSQNQFLCYARSADGVHWEKPALGLIPFEGVNDTNILMAGDLCHNFTPFVDENPACLPGEQLKAITGVGERGLNVFVSPDGIHWTPKYDHPVLTGYLFDSQNVMFYDTEKNVYRLYFRYIQESDSPMAGDYQGVHGVRAIQSCISEDGEHFHTLQPNIYSNGPCREHLYTNATVPCPGAEHILFSFPMRFVELRRKALISDAPGVSDAVFMSSRDGVHWERRFLDSFIAGEDDPKSWTHRNNMPTHGVLETGEREFSLFAAKHYSWSDASVARYTVRKHGLVGLYADSEPGTLISKPFTFTGSALHLNFSTAAVGYIKVALCHPETLEPYEGFSMDDCGDIFGDECYEAVQFAGGSLEKLNGKPVVLRAELSLATLFSVQFK